MRFIELWDFEEGYDYQVNVDHIVWLKQVELGEILEQKIERTIVKLSDGQEITASQTIAEIYNAL
jgi:hypothetical protein